MLRAKENFCPSPLRPFEGRPIHSLWPTFRPLHLQLDILRSELDIGYGCDFMPTGVRPDMCSRSHRLAENPGRPVAFSPIMVVLHANFTAEVEVATSRYRIEKRKTF